MRFDPSRGSERFYSARFVLRWATQQAEEFGAIADLRPGRRDLRTMGLPVAMGAIANYRMALEHAAQAVATVSCPFATPDRVSFPVAVDPLAFRSMMAHRFPGLRSNHPRVWGVFRQVQAFVPGNGDWLPMLHGLWNHSIRVRDDRDPDPVLADPRSRAPPPRGELVFHRTRSLRELLETVGPAEAAVIDRLERVVAPIDPTPVPVDRRERR